MISKYQIQPGYVYKFTFYSKLSIYDGIYKLTNIMSLDEIQDNAIDLYEFTFKPASYTEEEYSAEVDNIKSSRILKLKKADDSSSTLYIPEYYIIKQPNVNVSPYQRLGIVCNLGIFNDPNVLLSYKKEIEELLLDRLGIDKKFVIYTIEEIWMTDDEYQQIEEERKQNKTLLKTSVYHDKKELERKIQSLQTIIKEYEQLILNSSIKELAEDN